MLAEHTLGSRENGRFGRLPGNAWPGPVNGPAPRRRRKSLSHTDIVLPFPPADKTGPVLITRNSVPNPSA